MAILLTMTPQKAMNLRALEREQCLQEFSLLVKYLLRAKNNTNFCLFVQIPFNNLK